EIYTLSLHDALPIYAGAPVAPRERPSPLRPVLRPTVGGRPGDGRGGVLPWQPRRVRRAPRPAIPGQPRPESCVRSARRDDAGPGRRGDGRRAVTVPRAEDGLPGGQLRVAPVVAVGPRRALGGLG